MIKIIKVLFISIFVILVLAIAGLAIFLKTFDLNKYLPQIVKAASDALGRPVHIDRADLNLSLQGIVVDVSGVRVDDDPQFSSSPVLEMEKAHLALEFAPLLMAREVRVGSVLIEGTRVNIVRSAEGVVNAALIGKKPEGQTWIAAKGEAVAVTPAPVEPLVLPALSVKSIIVRGASIEFTDHDPKMPLHVIVPGVDITVNEFSLTKSFPVVVDLSLASGVRNIHATMDVQLDVSGQRASVTNGVVQSDLSQLKMDALKAMSPVLAEAPLPLSLEGKVRADIKLLEAGAKGLEKLDAQIELSQGGLKLKEILVSITKIHALADVGIADAKLSDLSLNIGEGTVKIEGDVKDYLKAQQFTAKINAAGIKIEELIDQAALPVVVKGKVNADVALAGAGFAPDVMMKGLTGKAKVSVTDGVIEKLNILKAVLGPTLGMVPGLADSLDQGINAKLQDKLGEDATVLQKAEAQFTIADSAATINEAVVSTKVFDVTASGRIGFDMTADIPLSIVVAQDLSAQLVKDTQGLSYLSGEDGRIRIDGRLTGLLTAPKFTPVVDLKKIGRNAIMEEGSKQLQKVIEKNPEVGDILNSILGGGSSKAADQDAQPASQVQDSEASSGDKNKKLINNVLNDIFK